MRSVTFSDVDLSLEEREQAMMVATCSNLSSATSNTEYFSAVSSDDEEDDFFDIQTDTEKEFDDEDDTPTPTPVYFSSWFSSFRKKIINNISSIHNVKEFQLF